MSNSNAQLAMISTMIRGEDALAPFMTNIDCASYEQFERYLAGQVRQAMELRIDLESRGDPDSMLDWTLAKIATFRETLLTFRRVMAIERGLSSPPTENDPLKN